MPDETLVKATQESGNDDSDTSTTKVENHIKEIRNMSKTAREFSLKATKLKDLLIRNIKKVIIFKD